MSPLDLWAATAASVASAAIAIRANMLKPHARAWTHAPAPVWIGLVALAIGLGMTAASLWTGAHATPREAMVYTLLAAVAVVMLWNLDRHGRAAAVKRQAFAEEARLAVELSPPPARYFGERRR